jgi:hypothetical protein
MKQRILTLIVASLAVYAFAFSILSRTFDGDFGWHLRFGKETTLGALPYIDTYTYTFFGRPWNNHEWGGDVLFWLIYDATTNIGLTAFIVLGVTLAFLLFPVIFLKRFSLATILASGITLATVDYILSMRQTTMAPLLFVALIYLLEAFPRRPRLAFYLIPLMWAWSAFHGSWILGYMTVAVYAFGNALEYFSYRYIPRLANGVFWRSKDYALIGGVTLASILSITINPYGWHLLAEVGSYFTENYFKQYITEWLPSYTYPVYWSFFVLVAVVLIFTVRGWLAKKITIPQLGVIAMIMLSAILYRRNALYFAMLATPFIAYIFAAVWEGFSPRLAKHQKTLSLGILTAALAVTGYFFRIAWYIPDPWTNDAFLMSRGFPAPAVRALERETKQLVIFNEFHWGGFLNWTLPDSLVYLDGRGTATWRLSPSSTLYGDYRRLRFDPGGLALIETSPAQYILLEKRFSGYYKTPNRLDRLVFGSDLEKIVNASSTQLEIDLVTSTNWSVLFEDTHSIVYRRSRE